MAYKILRSRKFKTYMHLILILKLCIEMREDAYLRQKHVACIDISNKFVVDDGSAYVNFHRLKLNFTRYVFLPWISSDRPKLVSVSML
jgi:hypothetical protein